jgi:hypothetical protein
VRRSFCHPASHGIFDLGFTGIGQYPAAKYTRAY